MTIHNIDKFHKCTEAQIYTKLSPDTDGVFAYATDTGSLYVSHNGGWVIADLGTGVKNYQYAGVDINPLVHVDATNTSSLRTIDDVSGENQSKIHEWKDLSGRNDLIALSKTNMPTLSANAINGKPGVDFSTAGQIFNHVNAHNDNNEGGCQFTSKHTPNRTLKHVTCFVVTHMPSQVPWDEATFPDRTNSHNKFALPLVATTNVYKNSSMSVWYMGYKRYGKTLDRYYVGSGGTYNYRNNYQDQGVTTMSSEVRVAPKILWATGTFSDPEHKSILYSGINGAGRLTNRGHDSDVHTPPDMACISVGMDAHSLIGEVLLCDQSMTGAELNKIGSHLSNKWNITWSNLPELT